MMERSTVMKTFPGSLSNKQPTFDMGEPSPPFISFQQKTIATIRDASFSSYLKPEQLDNQADDPEISIFDAQKYFNESSGSDHRVGKRVSPVNVINIESIPRFSSVSSSVDGHGRNYRARSFHATPTASSEASWNSQTGLLSNPPGAIAVSMRNPPPSDEKKKGSKAKWLLGRKCPCAGKKSIQVEEKLSEPITPSRLVDHKSKDTDRNLQRKIPDSSEKSSAATDWLQRHEVIPNSHRITADNNRFPLALSQHHHRVLATSARPFSSDGTTSGFSFPILNQTSLPPIKLVLNGLQSSTNYNPQLEDPPRDSLEVFLPSDDPIPTNNKTTMDLHQRQSFTFPASPKSRMIVTDDDIASDASSDLFEIESFSTQTTSYQMHNNNHGRRDSLDDASVFNGKRLGGNLYCRQSLDESMTPSIAPTECYAPSEASIDWSVTTAEGFDRASVTNFSMTASEVDHQEMISMRHHESERTIGGGGGSGGKRRGGNRGLLSCRCEKAVNVGPHPVKCVGGEGQRGESSTTRHVSSRPPIANKPPLARSHSARLSLPFAS
ncbi:protein PHYTOCHROME KINASE SUBSTRATE 4 [Ricinus communis]|uniref:protein PHYTOCHROME KINASE SUBSTRATE 4 n=1 Tax=Ricinus communis TaxID=3988 RepID=UPI00201AD190|nr:protein PHYTOCHROME KINASE SUBSTRATE 4 [Ricinus communis]